MLNKLKRILVNDIGIDLGTMNTLVWVAGEGIVLEEPSYVAINADTNKVRAVGADAKKLMAMTAERIKVIRPMREGVIADAEVTDEMLRIFIRKASGHFKIMQPRVLIAVPSGITEVGVRAVQESAMRAGARVVRLVEEPFASALGVGLPVEDPDGNMIVDIGGGTTEVAIISAGSIVSCQSVKYGGDAMDNAIIQFMLKKHQLQIGPRTAENIKINIGSAYELPEKLSMEVKGLDMGRQGDRLPRAVVIDSDEVREALSDPISNMLRAIRKAIDQCPPEIAARLLDTGITMAGGGSLLRGLDKLITENTGLHAVVGPEPLHAVVNGTGMLLDNARQLFSQPQNTLIGHGARE
ncbi:MAG: rod shape-determining protein [Victivallales bacterium]|nr:rod shape-determining protein [Victivallales bacterium]